MIRRDVFVKLGIVGIMSNKVSVILPVYNVENYIKKSLDSIINQTFNFNDIEVIMVDDCSTDNSGIIIDEYASKYDNFKAIHLDENSGAAGKPRNVGLEMASSEFVMFLDSDDCFRRNAIEKLYHKLILDKELDIVLGGYVNIYDGKKEVILPFKDRKDMYFNDVLNEFNLVKINPAISSKLFRKDFLIKNNIKFPEGIPGQDLVFFLNSFFQSNKVLSLSNFIVYERILRSNGLNKSISFNVNYNYIAGLIKAYTLILNIFKENNVNISLSKLILISHLRFFSKQLLKSQLTKDELLTFCNSNEFHNFINNDFFNVASEFRFIFNNMKKNNFDNISLIDYIKENIEKEVKYQYENSYLKNKNKKLCLELEGVHNSKLWKLRNILK